MHRSATTRVQRAHRSFLSIVGGLCVLLRLDVIAADTNAAPGATFHGVFYPSNSLGYVLESQYQAFTNARPGYQVWNDRPWVGFQWMSTNVGACRWNTNSLLFGRLGATAISVAQFGGTQARVCLLTRRHAVTAGHYGAFKPGSVVWFLGTNNAPCALTVARCLAAVDGEDRAVLIFTQDAPENVTPMRIVTPFLAGSHVDVHDPVWHYFPPAAWRSETKLPVFWVCQHGYCGRYLQPHPGGGRIGVDGGDSGSPGMLLLGDECLYVTSISTHPPTSNLFRRMNESSLSLGLDTNRYQPAYFSLTNYPRY